MNIATTGIVKGSLSLNKERRRWLLEADHDAMRLLKRMFGRIPASAVGKAELADNTRTRAELYWVLARWRFAVSAEDAALVEEGMLAERAREERVARILAADYVPRRFELVLPLRPYQQLVADIVLQQGYVLSADEMGLGKTAEAIGVLSDPATRPALVVCPTPLPWQWKAQIDKFLPGMRIHIARNGKVPDLGAGPRGTRVPPPDVVILSYSKLAKWAPYLATFCTTAIYDEAQAFRHEWTSPKKEDRTKVYEAGLYLRDRMKYRLALTGTPIYNRGGEIRNVLNILVEDAVGNDEEFAREWTGGSRSTKALVHDPSALGIYLRDRLLMIRHTRKGVGIHLPKCTRNVQVIDSDPKALEAIKSSVVEYAKLLLQRGLAGEDKRDAGRELNWRLRQATGIAKAPFVAEVAKMILDGGEPKIVIFTWHLAVNKILAHQLADYRPVFYTGQESDVQKRAAAEAFVRGRSRVLVMSNRAGVGIDGLQDVCSCGIIAELDYSPKQHDQNITRLDRPGQTKPVMIHILMTNDGSDPVLADMLGIKQEQSDRVLDPDADPFELAEIPEDKMRLLATDYLARHAPAVLEAVTAENEAKEAAKLAEKEAKAQEALAKKKARQERRRASSKAKQSLAGQNGDATPSNGASLAATCPVAPPSIGTAATSWREAVTLPQPSRRFTPPLRRGQGQP
jgi:superfamily II DNA or RNA helicase